MSLCFVKNDEFYFNNIISKLTSMKTFKLGMLDMFGIYMFQILERVYCPVEMMRQVYFRICDWELENSSRWDMEPSGVFLLTRVFYFTNQTRVGFWGAMACLNHSRVQCNEINTLEIENSLNLWNEFRNWYSEPLYSLPMSVRIHMGWHKSKQENENWVAFYEIESRRKLLVSTISTWKNFLIQRKEESKNHGFILQNWIQRFKIKKKIIKNWICIQERANVLRRSVWKKWKTYVEKSKNMRCLKLQKKYFQRWYFKTSLQKKNLPIKKHFPVLVLKSHRVNLHFIASIIFIGLIYIDKHAHSPIFTKKMNYFSSNLTHILVPSKNYREVMDACFNVLKSDFPALLKKVLFLEPALDHVRSFFDFIIALFQELPIFTRLMSKLQHLILPSLMQKTLVSIQVSDKSCFISEEEEKENILDGDECFLNPDVTLTICSAWFVSKKEGKKSLWKTFETMKAISNFE